MWGGSNQQRAQGGVFGLCRKRQRQDAQRGRDKETDTGSETDTDTDPDSDMDLPNRAGEGGGLVAAQDAR